LQEPAQESCITQGSGLAHDVTLEAQELEPFYDMGIKEIVNRWKHIFFIPTKQKTILDYPTKIGE
jgi:hypothetical protein